MRSFVYIILLAIGGFTLLQGFQSQIDNFISVTGKVIYNNRKYEGNKVKVTVLEDGKVYKTTYCDDKGRFETKILLNHNYLFKFSMDFHATSRVLVNTDVPEKISSGSVGGLFNFECEIFERFQGMNYALLNKPLLKIKYYPEENEFKNDEKYSNDIMFDLMAFKDRLDEMKMRQREVLKVEPQASRQPEVAQNDKPKRKPIVFEEKEEPKAVNKFGHRNIMDQFNDEESEKKEAVAVEESIPETGEDTAFDLVYEEKEKMESEEVYLEEEVDISEYLSINVIPKRIVIKDEEKAALTEGEKTDLEITFERMKRREATQLKRIAEEAKIRHEVTSFAERNFALREERLENKKIQTQRIRSLIKTVALAEIYYKKEYYRRNPIHHNMIKPVVLADTKSEGLMDSERISVKYPKLLMTFRRDSYPLGIEYFFINGEETDGDTYCSTLSDMDLEEYTCTN